MKKFLLVAVASIMAISAFAQEIVKVRVYKGETIAYEENYADIDSIVFIHEIIPVVPDLPEGSLSGEFSVSATRKVHFSKGNLQATSTDLGQHWTWSFAPNQWTAIGGKYPGRETLTGNNFIKSDGTMSNNGTVDLFGWSTASNTYGISSSTAYDSYSGDFKDWGETIGEGWFTISKDEWVYLLHGRDRADELIGMGFVNNVRGTIILPDDWILPEGVVFNSVKDKNVVWLISSYKNEYGDNLSHNTYNAEQWAVMEAAGAVFLPFAGHRTNSTVDYIYNYGQYWTSTPYGENRAYYALFSEQNLHPQDNYYRYWGLSVRLVYEVK